MMAPGPLRGLVGGLLLMVLAPWPTAAGPDALPVEYVDEAYAFSFRFPAGWEWQELPVPGGAGEVRVAVKNPAEPVFAMAVVSPMGEGISKEDFERSRDRDAVVADMIGRTLARVYGKMARDLAARRTIVASRRGRASDVGLMLYIETTQIIPDGVTAVAGVHVVPFGKPYSIALLVISRGAGVPTSAEMRGRLFDSLRVDGERPPGTLPRRGSGG